MLTWIKWKSLYGYKHTAETIGYEFEIEKQITEGRTKKHWHLIIIRKGVYGANRIAANGMVRTVKAAKDQAGEFMKNEGMS